MEVKILPNLFIKENGTFDKEKALLFSGKIAGVCYDKEGYEHLEKEEKEKTIKRINNTLINGHHSVYDHITINLNLKNIPKILAIVLNNEHQYTTSEKSGRYTNFTYKNNEITEKEIKLYTKWFEKFKTIIKEEYPSLNDFKIKTLAQENARYLITIFTPTEMIYSTSLRQINYIASFMKEYIDNHKESKDNFEKKLAYTMKEFIEQLDNLNILEEKLMQNDKQRKLCLFNNNIEQLDEIYNHIYSTNYELSFAAFAQTQRHRTINYQIKRMSDKKYFVPPILLKNKEYTNEWLEDMQTVSELVPQGELILVNENGTYENFILKTKERLCSAAQLEIMISTRNTLLKYKEELEKNNNPLKENIKKYTKGARCTFGYKCSKKCDFKEGITLEREI